MSDSSIDLGLLWDADAYARSGPMPWTIFAYPVRWADERRLPRDREAVRYLSSLRARGVSVGVWEHPRIADTIYFACPYEERERVAAVIAALEGAGEFAPGFAAERTEYLFATMTSGD